jgi:hypothetical protein
MYSTATERNEIKKCALGKVINGGCNYGGNCNYGILKGFKPNVKRK